MNYDELGFSQRKPSSSSKNLPEFGSITPVSSELTVGGIEVERDTLFKLCIKAMGRLSIYFLLVDNIIKQTLTSLQA